MRRYPSICTTILLFALAGCEAMDYQESFKSCERTARLEDQDEFKICLLATANMAESSTWAEQVRLKWLRHLLEANQCDSRQMTVIQREPLSLGTNVFGATTYEIWYTVRAHRKPGSAEAIAE